MSSFSTTSHVWCVCVCVCVLVCGEWLVAKKLLPTKIVHSDGFGNLSGIIAT